MTRTFVIRLLSLYLPLASAFAVWLWRKPGQRELTGALLATAWNLPALFAINLLAIHFRWWHFNVQGAVVAGLPVDLWLGWSVMWGMVAALVFRHNHVLLAVSVCAIADIILMPACRPVLILGKTWLLGEALALLLCLAPGLVFARWTTVRRNAKGRALFQAICFSGLLAMSIFLLLSLTGRLSRVTAHTPSTLQFFAAILLLAALPGLSAVQEFAERGDGTPLPFDPPQELVTSGIYSYTANPMQTCTALILFLLSIFLGDWRLLLAYGISLVYSAGLAAWDEGRDMQQKFGQPFAVYRNFVRNWLPRWRPYVAEEARISKAGIYEARIYFAGECGKCSEMADFIRSLRPHGLKILAAENHPTRDLTRMTYEREGLSAEGLAALARALEHVNLAWALCGMFLRLPVLNQILQSVLDVSGGGPKKVTRCAALSSVTTITPGK